MALQSVKKHLPQNDLCHRRGRVIPHFVMLHTARPVLLPGNPICDAGDAICLPGRLIRYVGNAIWDCGRLILCTGNLSETPAGLFCATEMLFRTPASLFAAPESLFGTPAALFVAPAGLFGYLETLFDTWNPYLPLRQAYSRPRQTYLLRRRVNSDPRRPNPFYRRQRRERSSCQRRWKLTATVPRFPPQGPERIAANPVGICSPTPP